MTAALERLRSRPLSAGTDVTAAAAAGAKALAAAGKERRIVLLTDGTGAAGKLNAARGGIPLFTLLTGEERHESYTVASARVLLVDPASSAAGESAEETLFFRSLFAPTAPETKPEESHASEETAQAETPIRVTGADPKLRDVYAVMTQPPTRGSLSGWVGRYATSVPSATLALEGTGQSTTVSFPEKALEARDLPRRWARARVDDLLRRIELEGEKREWVEEIIELSRRYKFVTPYTAFLAAPRSLLRPRRIQPGDPVLRIETDPGVVAVTALLPFGKKLELTRQEKSARASLFTGRFLVPEGLPDGRMAVRLVLRDVSGKTIVEMKSLVLDGTPPQIHPEVPKTATSGDTVLVAARADSDTIFLSARLDDGPPIPLRWDAKRNRSVAEVAIPTSARGVRQLFFEAADGAGNRGFARAALEVR